MSGRMETGLAPAPFVGRQRELQALLDLLRHAGEGRGRVVLVGGEPGIGKSRLIEELSERAAAGGTEVVVGRCWEAGGAPPFWPWVQSLRAYLQARDAADIADKLGPMAADIAQMLPDVRRLLPHLEEPPSLDADAARFRLFDATASFLRRAAEERPLLVVLDDLHAADAPSLLLLRFVARELDRTPLLIVGAYRDTEVGDVLREALADLRRQPSTRHVALEGLTEEHVAQIVHAALGDRPSPALVKAVHGETEGNPLFVSEIVRLLAAEGWPGAGLSERALIRAIPDSVREVIGRRLAHLSEPCRRLLTVASVFGREFELEPLERVTGERRPSLLRVLEEAVAARVVVQVPNTPARLRFSHALVRDVLYAELDAGERARLHGTVGEALEAVYGRDTTPHLAELAHHFLLAAPGGDTRRAVSYARLAGRRAVTVLAYEEAVRLFEMALEALRVDETADARTESDLLLALGDALTRAGEAAAGRETLLRAADVARTAGMPDRFALAALGYGGRFVWEAMRGDEHLVPLLEEALTFVGNEHPALRARLLARLAGGPLRDDVDRTRRDALSREAVDLARRVGDAGTLAWALDGRHAAVWWPENLDERLRLASDLIEAATSSGDTERVFQAHHYRFIALLERGDIQGTRAELDAQVRLAAALGQPAQLAYVAACRATMATLEGRFAAAEQDVREAYTLARRAFGSMAEVWLRVGLYAVRRGEGRLGEVEDLFRRAVEEFPTYGVFPCIRAHVAVELGREELARTLLLQVRERGFAFAPLEEWVYGVTLLAEVAAALEEVPSAEGLYALLEPYAARVAVSAPDDCTGSVSRTLALLAEVLGREADARRHFEQALSTNERLGAHPWLAVTRFQYARFLIARDRERALNLLAGAALTARNLGMHGLEERCAELQRTHGVHVALDGRRVIRTFIFTDIVRSTDLIAAIGDSAWESLRRWHDRTLRELLREHAGEEVAHTGDGLFGAFEGAAAGVRCAMAIQRRLAEHRRTHGFAPQVRIGLHTAKATETEDGYAGRGVHEAARIAALAQPDEILASRRTLEEAGPGVAASALRSVNLKGISEPVSVASIAWR